jgi:WD40 repeat protein/3',5'-cyclic AMP phosphodiesterase CpdA
MLTILHLSDLQFGRVHRYGEPQPGSTPYDTLLERLKEELDGLRAQHQLSPELVIVTGDLAEWGMPREFDQVSAFLKGLQAHLGLERWRFVVVPGNHDINRKLCESYFNECAGMGEEPVPPFTRKWHPWIQFFTAFYSGMEGIEFRPEQPWTLFDIPELRVVIAGLNSTLRESHREADHYGWVGEEQLRWFANRMKEYEQRGWFRIAAVHHNVQRQAEADDENLRDARDMERILGPHLNLVLHGHTHEASEGWWGPALPILSTGSAAVKQEARPAEVPNQCQLLVLQPGGFERVTREYAGEQKRWIAATRHSETGESWRIIRKVAFSEVHGTFPSQVKAEPAPDEAMESSLARSELEERFPGGGFADQVATVCRVRADQANIHIRRSHSLDFPWLEVAARRDDIVDVSVIAAVVGHVTRESVQSFFQQVVEPRRQLARAERAIIVVGGNQPIPEDVRGLAQQHGIRVESFTSFQGLIDFSEYLAAQSQRLDHDPVYPPARYVRQLMRVGLRESTLVEDALEEVRRWIETDDHGRLALLLGSFGVGKTFLLRRLARVLADGPRAPILVDLRRLEKTLRLEEMLAAHCTEVRGYTPAKLAYMLREGRVVLLFDGFDELAMRVSYRRAADHLETLLAAATERAKVVITSRTEHFISDRQIESQLMADIRRISTLRVGILQPFDGDRIRHFLVHFFGGDEGKAERRYRQLERVKDLLGLSNNPRMLGFIAQLPAERLDAAEQREGGISAATLYRELIDYWLDYEIQRANPRGSPEGLTKEQCLRALYHLAERLWARTDRAIGLEELSEGVAQALGRLDHLDPEIATQLVGSGTLLVRDAEGRFSFLHQSVLEWLVADEVARQLSTGSDSELLERGEMSALMVEFLCDLAGRERAVDWAKRGLALQNKRGDAAQKNALAVIRWLKVEEGLTAMLAGADLQGQDLSGRNLRGADLRGANLRGARLSRADLTGAVLSRAVLSDAVLDEACLRDADLTSVEAAGARFSGADLRGARLDGATLRRASLLGARVEPAQLEKVRDLFGAAEPAPGLSAAHPVLASASGFARVLAWSPDDSLIAAGNIDGTLRVYSAADGSLLRVLTGGRGTLLNVAFLEGGQQLVAGWNDGSVWLWAVSTGQLRRVLHAGQGRAYLIAFCSSSSEPLAAISVGSGEIEVWSLQQVEVVRHLVDDEGRIRALAFLPDGQSLISGNTKGEILLWPMSGDSGAHRLAHRDDAIKSLAVSPDAQYLAVGSGQAMELMSMATTEVVHRFEGTREGSRMPVFSPDGLRLAGALSTRLHVWSVPEGKLLHQWEVEPEGLSSLAFSSDGQRIAADGAHSLRVWSASEGRILRTLNENSTWIRSAAFSPTGTHLATSSMSGRIRFWSTGQGKLHYDMDIGSERPTSVGVSDNLQYLACGSRNGLVRVWSLPDGKLILTMGTDSQRLESLAFSADGSVLAGGDDEGLVRLWSVPDGRLLRKHHVGDDVLVRKVKFSTDGKLLAACGGRSVEIYAVMSAAHRRTLDLHMEHASSLAFSADDQLIAIGDTKGGIQLWFAQSGTLKEVLKGHDRMVLELVFSPGNHMLASASSDGSICLWSVADGQLACSLGSHPWVESMCFSPDGERLSTIGADGTWRFWDVRTGKLVSTVLPLGDESWVLMTPNGRHRIHGKVGDALAYAINLVRFTPEEAVRFFPELRLPEGTGFLGPFDSEDAGKRGA